MPNKQEHLNAGLLWGAVFGALKNILKQLEAQNNGQQKQFDIVELIGSAFLSSIGGGLGAILPDILEPANDPNHRKFFHSIATEVGLSYLQLKEIREKTDNDNFWLQIVNTIGFGYIVHLLQDSDTPKGLPLI